VRLVLDEGHSLWMPKRIANALINGCKSVPNRPAIAAIIGAAIRVLTLRVGQRHFGSRSPVFSTPKGPNLSAWGTALAPKTPHHVWPKAVFTRMRLQTGKYGLQPKYVFDNLIPRAMPSSYHTSVFVVQNPGGRGSCRGASWIIIE